MDQASASAHKDEPVDYAAVGATQAGDLMQYPPEGFTPFTADIRLGSGAERFESAAAALFGWSAQRESGIRVADVHVPPGERYLGIHFDEAGVPLEQVKPAMEQRFTADGTPFVTSGMTVVLDGEIEGQQLSSVSRVVLVVEEPRTAGFALGTLSSEHSSGEESFMLEHREDDSVWFVYRAFQRPLSRALRWPPFLMRRRFRVISTAYLRAMSPAWSTGSGDRA